MCTLSRQKSEPGQIRIFRTCKLYKTAHRQSNYGRHVHILIASYFFSFFNLIPPVLILVNCWVASHAGNATHVVVIPCHHDVALVAPANTPGILYNPVVSVTATSVTHCQDSVIQGVRTTVVVVVHAACISWSYFKFLLNSIS